MNTLIRVILYSTEIQLKSKLCFAVLQAYRIKHLNRSDKEETIKKFIDYMKEVDIDWEKVAEKIEAEFERERRGERAQD